MAEFLERKDFFYANQFGFSKGYSMEHAVQYLTSMINGALDGKLKVATLFLDILKAFGTVDYVILLKKLDNCGIRGNTLKIISSYLSHRSLYVQLNDVKLSDYHVSCGVPQWPSLSLLFFSISINNSHHPICDLTTNVGNGDERINLGNLLSCLVMIRIF
jgi:hypothetical protein